MNIRLMMVKVSARLYIGASNICRVCLKWSQTRSLMVRHLTKSQGCLPTLIRCVSPLSISQASELDIEDARYRRNHAHVLKQITGRTRQQVRAHGPLRDFANVTAASTALLTAPTLTPLVIISDDQEDLHPQQHPLQTLSTLRRNYDEDRIALQLAIAESRNDAQAAADATTMGTVTNAIHA